MSVLKEILRKINRFLQFRSYLVLKLNVFEGYLCETLCIPFSKRKPTILIRLSSFLPSVIKVFGSAPVKINPEARKPLLFWLALSGRTVDFDKKQDWLINIWGHSDNEGSWEGGYSDKQVVRDRIPWTCQGSWKFTFTSV